MKFTFKLSGVKVPASIINNNESDTRMVEVGALEVTSEVSAEELKQYTQSLRDLGLDNVIKGAVSEFTPVRNWYWRREDGRPFSGMTKSEAHSWVEQYGGTCGQSDSLI